MSISTDPSTTKTTTQVHRVYIKATPEAIWTAITDPEWTRRYGYGGYAHYDLRPGGEYRHLPDEDMKASAAEHGFPCPDVIVDGEVIEADPPKKLVTTWRMLMDQEVATEGFTTLTWEIDPRDGGFCALTVTHELDNAPKLALLVGGAYDGTDGGGGHPWILSDLKSLLETGSKLAG
jgi:uncharacterized protein YndB with AHSA1/START domain